MDGLKCKEELLSKTYLETDYFRLEAEYYNSTSVVYAKLMKGKDIVEKIQYGTSYYCDENKSEYPVLRLNELHNGFITTPQKYCHIISSNDFSKLKLKKDDVLVIRTNGNPNLVGKAAVVMEDAECAFASYLYRVITNKKINSTTLVAYLTSKYGRCEIDKNSVKGNQTNFSPAKFKDIFIPNFSSVMQKSIQAIFVKAYQLRQFSRTTYSNVEKFLLNYLGMTNYETTKEAISTKFFSKSFMLSGRLDAEYYQPKYDDYNNALKTKDTVHTLCNLYDKSFHPESDVEYNYIELANVGSSGDINDVEIILGENLPSRARRKVKAGQVIIASVEGSLQSCALITDEYDNAICSTGFYVLDSDIINSETLLVLFKSEPIQALLKQRCSGTILTAITKDELLNMPLLKIEEATQQQIAAKVQESFALRHQSEQLLENAKRAVEIAIEQGEDKAMKWLKEKGVEC